MMRIAIFVIIFLLSTIFGCNDEGSGTAVGTFSVADCGIDEREINLKIDYFTSSYFENTLVIRLQHTTQNYTFADGLYLEIRDVENTAAHLGDPITITLVPSLDAFKQTGPSEESGYETGYPATPYNGPARAALYLYDTCPDSNTAFTDGQGTITFDHIYRPGKSKRISGTFSLEFVDPRTWKSPESYGDHAVISGDFDFEHTGRRTAGPGY